MASGVGVNKRAIVDQVIASLRREVDAALAAAKATREGATHEENRPENDKDTRAIEASYLAGAQAERVADLRRALETLSSLRLRSFASGEPIAISALVTLEGASAQVVYLIVPEGGGQHAEVDGTRVLLVTPRSPLGAALVGRTVGDDVSVQTQGGARSYEVVAVE
jgi:transcription elongation GreA/GreB family factor